MSFTDFASGFFGSIKDTIDTEINKRNELDFLEKQERIREKVRQEAEDRRVAAKTIIQGDTSQGPAQLQVEEYNPSGRLIGTRLATKGEEEKHVMDKQTRAVNLAAAKSEAEAKMRDEDRKERDLDSKIKYRAAATSAANRSNLAEPGGSTRGRSEADLSKTVVNLMGDPDYMAAVNAGDPRVMQRMGAPDKIVDAMKSVATGLGVSLPEDTRTTIERDLQKETTPEGRAKIWEIFLREMDIAAAKGRASGKGIRAPREQSN